MGGAALLNLRYKYKATPVARRVAKIQNPGPGSNPPCGGMGEPGPRSSTPSMVSHLHSRHSASSACSKKENVEFGLRDSINPIRSRDLDFRVRPI